MSRIAYSGGSWIDSNGPRLDIGLQPPSLKDYYIHIPECDVVLRLFEDECGADQPLGEIYMTDGLKLSDIPPFVHSAFRDKRQYYRSRVEWVQGYANNEVLFVVRCPRFQDFRLKLNLKTLVYSEPEFGVR